MKNQRREITEARWSYRMNERGWGDPLLGLRLWQDSRSN
jgi:hypothetical protein